MVSLDKQGSRSVVFLKDKPKKYKYKTRYTFSEGVLFLANTNGMRHSQALVLSINEQNRIKTLNLKGWF